MLIMLRDTVSCTEQVATLLQRRLALKVRFELLVTMVLLSAIAMAESDWASKVRAVSPPNIVLTEIQEKSDFLRIVGLADDNADISDFMRAITQADLGSPELDVIQTKDGRRAFVLRVKT